MVWGKHHPLPMHPDIAFTTPSSGMKYNYINDRY